MGEYGFWRVAPGQSGDNSGCLGRRELVGDLGLVREDRKCWGNEFDLLYLAGRVQIRDSDGIGLKIKGVRGSGEELWSRCLRSGGSCLVRATGGIPVPEAVPLRTSIGTRRTAEL